MLSTSSLKTSRKPSLHPVWTGCSRVFSLSSKNCLLAGILDRCLLDAPSPRPADILTVDVLLAPLLSTAHIELLASNPFPVVFVVLFATDKLTERRLICPIVLSFIFRFCSGFSAYSHSFSCMLLFCHISCASQVSSLAHGI